MAGFPKKRGWTASQPRELCYKPLVAAAFEGKSRVDRQRMVYALLSEEMAERVHALALTTKAPGEV